MQGQGDTTLAERGGEMGASGEWTEDTWNENVNKLKDYSFNQKDEYKDRVDNILNRFEDRLNAWHATEEMPGAPGQTGTTEHSKVVTDLRQLIDGARANVSKLDASTEANWSTVKSDIDKEVADLHQDFKQHGVPLTGTKTGTMDRTPERF